MDSKQRALTISNGIVIRIGDLLTNIDRNKDIARDFATNLPCGGRLSLHLRMSGCERYLQIKHIDPNGDVILDYFVFFEAVPTNVGQHGVRLYFCCPESGRRCMDLYSFQNGMFRCRDSQDGKRVYYDAQLMNHDDRSLYTLNFLEKVKLPALKNEIHKHHYAGKITKPMQRVLRQENRLEKKQVAFINKIEEEGVREMRKLVSGERATFASPI